MAVKLTKNELKTQKDQLKQYCRYLPTLVLKKQQLQMVILQITSQLNDLSAKREKMIGNLDDWVAVFAENQLFEEKKRLENLVLPDRVIHSTENIAGVMIPVFNDLSFREIDYNVEDYPLWVDTAIVKLREIAKLDALVKTLQQQMSLIGNELRVTSQRVNLFEKVKIPQAKENIRKIEIFLGDQQTAAVVRGKIAKGKLQGDDL